MSLKTPMRRMFVFEVNRDAENGQVPADRQVFAEALCNFITGRNQQNWSEPITYKEAWSLGIRSYDWYIDMVAREVDDFGNYHLAFDMAPPVLTPPIRYSNVAIFLQEFPPEEVRAEMVERAKLFCQNNNLHLVGCWQLEPKYEIVEAQVWSA